MYRIANPGEPGLTRKYPISWVFSNRFKINKRQNIQDCIFSLCIQIVYQNIVNSRTAAHKDSFLRVLREVAPEMELFLENHGQYIKILVIKLIYIQSCTFRHFTKKLYLEEYVWKDIPPHFFAETLSQTLLRKTSQQKMNENQLI